MKVWQKMGGGFIVIIGALLFVASSGDLFFRFCIAFLGLSLIKYGFGLVKAKV